ncbi:MAG: AAA family ATPase [Verrucomicrobia bacterium]|nr:AAA family ATPase [Verrucomicrobiota bacterium]MDE3099634.1 AAA family ATPase [Verrucomicrobiota bacterium]
MNTSTPRIFIAATRQNDGKTTVSLGLISALQEFFPRVGYIKPVGQRFIQVEEQKIDEDTVLMDAVYRMNCPLVDMSPIAVEPDFTRKYLQAANNETLVRKIQTAFDRVAWEKDFVLCEGSGHAGVGSVFDLSNARVAKLLGAKAVIVSQGGIGRPIDEIALNQALFEKEEVEIAGVILNKVLGEKVDYVTDFARRGLKRKGLELLGVLPHQRILCNPSIDLVREELGAELLNPSASLQGLADDVVVGAMSAQNAIPFFRRGVLLITPGDREDLVLAAGATTHPYSRDKMAGIVLTGGLRPAPAVAKAIQAMPIPVLLASADSYEVASRVNNLIVKTRPADAEKISLIRDIVAKNVNVKKIVESL